MTLTELHEFFGSLFFKSNTLVGCIPGFFGFSTTASKIISNDTKYELPLDIQISYSEKTGIQISFGKRLKINQRRGGNSVAESIASGESTKDGEILPR